MTPGSHTVPPYAHPRWTKTKSSAIPGGEVARDARRRGGRDRWQRFAALPIGSRRALVACTAWLIAAYVGLVLLAAGVDAWIAPERHALMALALTLGGAGFAVLGFVRARSSILRGRFDT